MNGVWCVVMAALGVALPYEEGFDGDLDGLRAQGWRLPSDAALETEGAHAGAGCLRVTGVRTQYAGLFIPVEEGKFYGAEVWVRCQDVGASEATGKGRGAVIFLEWANRDKKWVGGGSFPIGLDGTHDWTHRRVRYTRRIPPEVGYLHVLLGVEGAGTAWFDGFRVFEIAEWADIAAESPPAGGTVDVRRPLLAWRVPEEKVSGGRVVISRSSAFPEDPAQTLAFNAAASQCRPPRGLEPGAWFWRVHLNRGDLEMPPSPIFSFTVAEDAALWPPDIVPAWAWSDAERPVLEARVSDFVIPDQLAIAIDGAPAAISGVENGTVSFSPAEALAPGVHDVVITATGPGGRSIEVRAPFNNKAPGSRVAIRDDGMLLVDERPFFPLGAYRDPSDTLTDFSGLKEAGFNVTHSYLFEDSRLSRTPDRARAYLEAAHANGLKVFMGFNRAKVREGDQAWLARWAADLMDEPALLTWYLMDEPAGQGVPVDAVANLARTVRAIDPFHPTSLVLCVPRAFPQYTPACDIVWNDPYPLPNRPLTMVVEWARLAREAARPGQPYWIVLQGHDGRYVRDAKGVMAARGAPSQPSPAQTRCMAYMALAEGVNGIIWYWLPNSRYHICEDAPEVWRGICDTVQELNGLMPYLLARRTPEDALDVPEPLLAWTRRADGRRVLALVNTGDAPCDVEVDLSPLAVDSFAGAGETGAAPLEPGRNALHFAPYEVKLYEGTAP
ncbi:MAG: hypothetical protein JXR94_10605 [Candidatus Hydrogenedentes bacterium]|nr:hypothetical protein [Candidatus Hydrogenedentota bacterium]